MRKFLLLVVAILGSAWLPPVFFFLGAGSGVAAICKIEHCTRDMTKGDTPHAQFAVMARLPSQQNKVVPVLLAVLPGYLRDHRDASLTMALGKGETDRGSWRYTAASTGQGGQIISADFFDDASIHVEYHVSGLAVEPLRSRSVNIGYALTSLPLGVALALLMHALARHVSAAIRKSLGLPVAGKA